MYDHEGNLEICIDQAMDNPFIEATARNMKKNCPDNEFAEDFAVRSRYQSPKKDQSIEDTKEKLEGSTATHEVHDACLPICSIADSLSSTFEPAINSSSSAACLGVDFGEVFALKRWLEAHHVIPDFTTDNIPWKKESIPWVRAPIWQFGPVNMLCFYVDGSVGKKCIGAACVLFIHDAQGWKFGGHIRHSHRGNGSSYDAEILAHLLAMKWCWDLLKLFQFHHYAQPEVHICFDSTSAALAADGKWKADINNPIFAATRSMHHICQTAFHIEAQMWHEKSHHKWPGNEAADVLAMTAISYQGRNS